jgi:hypothetical protein
MNLIRLPISRHLCCFVFAGLAGILPFFKGAEAPEAALQHFVAMFKAQDAEAVYKIMYPEVVSQTELGVNDVDAFLKRYRSNTLTPEKVQVEKRLKSEDGEAERFQATLLFRSGVLSPQYKTPALLSMTLLWVLEEDKWWIERPLAINYVVTVNDPYPTAAQQETTLRFQTTLGILDKLGLPGSEDLEFLPPLSAGSGAEEYREIEKLYPQERSSRGIDPETRGVQVFLAAASRKQGGFLTVYQADFENDPSKGKQPPPWDMYRDYVRASIMLAKSFEKQKKFGRAESIYRKLIALGRQLLDEPGGYQFVAWGITFQKQGAEELARLLASTGGAQKDRMEAFARLASRRLDLLQTALNCLDDMTDYRSLESAIVACEPSHVGIFRPWAVNTLAILALKGAPANLDAIKQAGAMVIVDNPAMRQVAWKALEKIASEPSGKMAAFVERQKQWVTDHEVYGTVQNFR